MAAEGAAGAPANGESATGAEASGEPVGLFAEEAEPGEVPADPVAVEVPADPVTAVEMPAETVSEEEVQAAVFEVFFWIFVVVVAFAAPFLAGFENILGILIIGFGLWQAWQLNRKRPFEVAGPFQVAAAAGGSTT